jgi:hypothetical protein
MTTARTLSELEEIRAALQQIAAAHPTQVLRGCAMRCAYSSTAACCTGSVRCRTPTRPGG